ncbi:hypothetical protein D3C85_953900 [compost metagenome]
MKALSLLASACVRYSWLLSFKGCTKPGETKRLENAACVMLKVFRRLDRLERLDIFSLIELISSTEIDP